MTYLVDTDWVIDFLKGRPDAVTLLNSLVLNGLAISVITYAEAYEGILFGRNPAAHESVLRRFLRLVDVLVIDRWIAHHYAILRGMLRAQGMLIPQPDILIAATAISHGLELVTRNVRDFQRIPGLALYQG